MSRPTDPKGVGYGPLCPTDPDHGRLLEDHGGFNGRWYCPDVAHSGRPKAHPEGRSEATTPFFEPHEVGL